MLKFITTIALLVFSLTSFAGSAQSEEGKALTIALQKHLIAVGICTNESHCHQVAPIYGRDGKAIEINLYSAVDPAVVREVFGFVAANGLGISSGKPIVLNAFSRPKESYVNTVKGMLENRDPPVSLRLKAK